MPAILITVAATLFFTVTNPMFNGITTTKAQVAAYNDALSTSKTLESEREALTAKYNAIDPANLSKIQKLLPDNINNIRLILEIEQIAAPYGMTLSNIQYNTTNSGGNVAGATPTATAIQGGNVPVVTNKGYGTFNLEFSTTGTYDNFISFTKDLESNLRIVDISSISFASSGSSGGAPGVSTKTGSAETYTYSFQIKTYWLKS